MDHNLQAIGNKIYTLRKSKDLTQKEMCKKLKIRQSSFSRLESGHYDIPYTKLLKLCEILDISISWLSGENNIPQLTDTERLEVENYIKYIVSKRK